MSEKNIGYPVAKPERRIRVHSRSDAKDRRSSPRFFVDFPITIQVGHGENQKTYQGTVKDISDGGLLIEAPDVPPEERRFRLQFEVPGGAMPEEFVHGQVQAEGELRRRKGDGRLLGVQLGETLSERLRRTTWNYLRWLAILVLIAAISLTLVIKYENVNYFWFDVPVFLYSLLVGGYLLSRFLFAAFYRESPDRPHEALPTLSVIIPAFNEEAHIGRTIRQAFESDYPVEKLQIIAIDDGSTDRTLAAIRAMQETYHDLVVVSSEKSRGKRQAMATGVKLATGDVIVFIDSDSFLDPAALRNLTNRFADSAVAAVTGHCDVENAWTNALTKMQAVRYFVAFRVMKAAESIFGAVTCLSGPLAAYRREALEEVLEEWLHQTFLGKPATFGDDRSLTNSLLRRGRRVVYEFKARTTTIVPDRYGQFLRQQMRWKRSWFRETLVASAFMWRKEPLMALSFYLGFFLPILAPAIVLRALIYVPLVQQQAPLMYIGGVVLMSSLISSTYLLYKHSRLWLYGIVFCFFYMFVLVWQLPWAILSFWKTSWGTRSSEI